MLPFEEKVWGYIVLLIGIIIFLIVILKALYEHDVNGKEQNHTS